MLYVYNILGFMLPIFNHENSFVAGNLTSHASDEQLKHWLPLAENYRMWGCFAQTELGHGSNISDLETTATYDASTREFILNTPTLSSTKWWIGALGTYATHALVMAKLILNGKDHGLAPFMVPVRDLETHKPLQGVTVGEIGPKLSPIENGFLRLSNVRIPLENLLTRHLNVTPDGQFVKPADSKLLMSGMLVRRTEITASSARALAKACTIGIRYALVRRQNRGVGPGPKKGEAQILTYPMVQMRLLPALAAAYSFQFIGSFLVNLFTNYRSQFLSQDPAFLATLSAFHPTLSSLKSYCTTLALDTIEDIRRTLGGHGYSLASGLGLLHGQWAIFATAEGEAVLMTQQVARWLMKLAREERVEGWRERMRGHVITEYLAELDEPVGKCAVTTSDGFLDRNVQRNVFAHRARRLLRECVEAVDANGGELGLAAPEAYAVSVAHTQNLIQSVFWNTIEELERKGVDGKLVKVLEKLAALNGVYLISKHSSDWLEDGHLDGSQIKLIKTAGESCHSTAKLAFAVELKFLPRSREIEFRTGPRIRQSRRRMGLLRPRTAIPTRSIRRAGVRGVLRVGFERSVEWGCGE